MPLTDPSLPESDPEIARLVVEENTLEHEKIRLIASENYASRAVMEATGSVFTNKYFRGLSRTSATTRGKQAVDKVEELAISSPQGPLRQSRPRERAALLGEPGFPAVYFAFCFTGRHR